MAGRGGRFFNRSYNPNKGLRSLAHLPPRDTKNPAMVEHIARIIDPSAWAETMHVVTCISGAENPPPHSEPVGNRLDDLKDKAREKARLVMTALKE